MLKQADASGWRSKAGLQRAIQLAVESLDAITGVEGTLVASRDGLLVAGNSEVVDRLELKAALSAAMFGAIDRASAGIEVGPVRAALLETRTHSLQMLAVSELIFIVVAAKGANMARVRTGMAAAAATLSQHAHNP